jgi:HlyD family secretion protein
VGGFLWVMVRSGPLAPVKVTTTTIQQGSLSPDIFGIGTVEARRSWMYGPTVAGRVLSVKVDVGDSVKAGQVLAEMDPIDIEQRLISLDASLERAKSVQAAAVAAAADARARRELAASSMRRNQDLANRNFISSAALETVVQTLASADAALEAAHANVRVAQQDLNRTVADRQALLKQQASIRLVATMDGIVSAREAEPGSTVVAGQSVVRLIDPNSLWVKLRVDQGRSGGLAPGLKARVSLRSQPQRVHAATVSRVEMVADSVAEERVAQLSFDQIPPGIAIGDMVEAIIQLPLASKALIAPAASLHAHGKDKGVWLMKAGKPVFAPVKLGLSSLDGQVQILEGVKEGDEIVVHSQKPLTQEMRVQVVDALVKPSVTGAGQ